MVRTKLTAKRWPRTSLIPPWLMNKRQQRKVKRPFNIKLTLPEQKTVTIKKGGKKKQYECDVRRNTLTTELLEHFNLIIINYCNCFSERNIFFLI